MLFYVLTIVVTAVATFGLTVLVWRVGLLPPLPRDPRARRAHDAQPRIGGVAMYLGVLVAFALSSQIPYFSIIWHDPAMIWSILGACTLIVVVGVADDLWDLDWMIKLGAQFLAAGIVVGLGGVQILALPFGDQVVFSNWVFFALAVLSIVVVMNAVNFIDGLDGLVAGVALIANAVFFVYTYLVARDTGRSATSASRRSSRSCSWASARASCRSTGIPPSSSWVIRGPC